MSIDDTLETAQISKRLHGSGFIVTQILVHQPKMGISPLFL